MSRSNWKGPYINEKNLKILEELKRNYKIAAISRNTEILPGFIEQSFEVYDGQKYNKVIVTEEKVGHKFGEFVSTRKKFAFKKKNRKNSK